MLLDEIRRYKLYLASQSPRRRELLSGMGFDFEVMPTHVEENHPAGLSPAEVVRYLSQLKLSVIDLNHFPENSMFIACDTIVVLGDEILEKPHDEDEALHMLRELSGREHTVMSGLTVMTRTHRATDHAETRVKFRNLSDDELRHYVHTYKPYDKAGAYGVQEWIGYVGIEFINGSFYNVMGLPTRLLWTMMEEAVKK